MNYDQIRINTHSSIQIIGTKTVWFDPFQVAAETHDADVICVTHAHYDHFDPESIEKIRKADTVFVVPAGMKKEMAETAGENEVIFAAPGQEVTAAGLTIQTIPAYNKLKPFHPKHNAWVGYLLTMDGVRYYIAGDTDAVKELRSVSCDVALVPVGGTYTMTAKEAAALINEIRPAAAIPTHYGGIVGKPEDGETFRSLVDPGIEVILKL